MGRATEILSIVCGKKIPNSENLSRIDIDNPDVRKEIKKYRKQIRRD